MRPKPNRSSMAISEKDGSYDETGSGQRLSYGTRFMVAQVTEAIPCANGER